MRFVFGTTQTDPVGTRAVWGKVWGSILTTLAIIAGKLVDNGTPGTR